MSGEFMSFGSCHDIVSRCERQVFESRTFRHHGFSAVLYPRHRVLSLAPVLEADAEGVGGVVVEVAGDAGILAVPWFADPFVVRFQSDMELPVDVVYEIDACSGIFHYL